MKKRKLIIGSRGSELALWQADFVKKQLEKSDKNLEVEIKIIRTKGDKILNKSLSKIGDKGLFTKELENELFKGSIDIAVHSLKDLQTELPEGLILAAVTKRHPVEDVLIARKKKTTIDSLREGAVVATGSLRRKAQLLHLRPDIKIVDLRGNVPTRINKFLESDWDAIILARAGVERLNLKKYISSYISVDEILPAVGQGALGIEVKEDNYDAIEILESIHDFDTYVETAAERSLLKALEGGCQVPIGAYAKKESNGLYLDAVVASLDGTITFRKKARGSSANPEALGKTLAKDLLRAGARKILSDIKSNG
ncbi:porphobilinogen deaminase [Melioribacter roseus P3M-2]|uniref:Porphobilinogen deaminase n=1 Tax=Melioribacter roseus (strain DSM 23840 / JCM 17771 / VKM B-2668 / P3M-2) TaxID=1191523 RepID=I6ZP88_MELRP|nr:hydroxymethylbilane synthase [Melioribacter roseus]AFN73854.1 porphobilinogen deaminase [Melioribacter roseus P3M-2]